MTWTGRRCVRRCLRWSGAWWRRRAAGVTQGFAVVLLLTVPGCCWDSSKPGIPPLPVLTSLSRAQRGEEPGVWMNSEDAGRLGLWIYEITGEDGSSHLFSSALAMP